MDLAYPRLIPLYPDKHEPDLNSPDEGTRLLFMARYGRMRGVKETNNLRRAILNCVKCT